MLKDKLRELRQTAHLTQADLASFLGIRPPTYTRYETGTNRPDYEVLCKLADHYDVTVDYLLDRDPNGDTPEYFRLKKLYKNANPQAKKVAIFSLECGQKHENVIQLRACSRIDMDYYEVIPASAGTGSYMPDGITPETLTLTKEPPAHSSFIVRVSGRSMEPEFYDGDKVFVRGQPGVDIGQIGIFILNDDVYIKKAAQGMLISLNPEYKPIIVAENSAIYCLGLVLGVCDESYFD